MTRLAQILACLALVVPLAGCSLESKPPCKHGHYEKLHRVG